MRELSSSPVHAQSSIHPTIKKPLSPCACARPEAACFRAVGRDVLAIALRLRAAGSSFFWAMQLLPYQRREAMYALYAFCREVDDIADGDAPRSLKDVLLSDWRSEIALLYAGCPQH